MAEEAINEYGEVLKVIPDDLSSLYNRGVLYLENGKLDDAASDIKKIVARNPRLATAHDKLGDIYQKQGHLDEAIAEYKKALEISPEMKDIFHKLEGAHRIKEQQTKSQMKTGEKPQ